MTVLGSRNRVDEPVSAEVRPVRRRRRGVPYWFVVPAVVVYAVVVLYPTIAGAVYAFTDWDGRQSAQFIGLENFATLLSDAEAMGSLVNSLVFAISVTVLQTVVGLALALALNSKIKSRNLLRTVFFAPALLPAVIIGFLWQYIYTPEGPLDTALSSLGLGFLSQNWLGDSTLALWCIVAVMIWQNAGLSMVIFLAGLQGVPRELYEAAAMDGASPVRQFRHVTLPMIAPATTIVLSLTLISSVKVFDHIFVMTGGGPGYATQTLSITMYKQAFVSGNYGYGAAIALALTMIVAFLAFVQLSALRRFEVEA